MFHGVKQKIKWRFKNYFFVILILLIYIGVARASDDLDLDAIEAEMSRRGEEQAEKATPVPAETSSSDASNMTFQDLTKLSDFSDITVIQKKFMPKTNRFQIYGGMDFLTNNPFFDSYGFNGRFAFYFSELFGIELSYWRHTVASRTITADLESKHRITAKTMLSSLGSMGISIVYVPFYGKMTFLDRMIIPYDFYFSVGGGTTETSYVDKAAPSLFIGTGEIFSLTKSFAWRWDFSSISYSARVPDVDVDSTSGSVTDSGKKQSMNDLYLGIGLTILFPGASYR